MLHLPPLHLPTRRRKFFLLTASALLAISGVCKTAHSEPSGFAIPNYTSIEQGGNLPGAPPVASGSTSSASSTIPSGGAGVAVSSPSLVTTPSTASSKIVANSSGINIPSPPPASAFSNDPAKLAQQAEAAALQAQADADADAFRKEREHNAKSFQKASTGLLPLAPDQIRDFMKRLEQTQQAAQMPYEGTPKGITRLIPVSLDPGVSPPQINLNAGFITTVTVVDSTGEPWPILDVGIGGNFEVQPTPAGSHVVRIMPLTRVGVGNLSVMLRNLPTPVIFKLSSGGPTVDLRFDARVDKSGPNAKPQIVDRASRPQAGDDTLAQFLETTPPAGAKRMKVGGLDARTKAWAIGDKVFLRTPLTLLSPAWNASMVSPDGTSVYEVGSAPVLLLSDNGNLVRAQILREEEHDN